MKRYVIQSRVHNWDPWEVCPGKEFFSLEEARKAFEALPVKHAMDVLAAAAPLGADKQFLQNEGNSADTLPDRTPERSAVPLEEAIWGPRGTDDLWSAEARAGSPSGGVSGSEPNLFRQGGGDIHLTVHVEAINVQGGADADFVDEIAETLAQKLKTALLRSGW